MDIVMPVIIGGVVLIVVIYAVKIFNNLIVIKNNIGKAWANIDVLLKQRYDEIPKLVKTTKAYMKYEKETIVEVIRARDACAQARGVEQRGKAEDVLSGALGKLFALSEKYPELKANEQFNHLHTRISDIESQIADRREFYNDSVNVYNITIVQIPDAVIALLLGYKTADMFKIPKIARRNVKVDF